MTADELNQALARDLAKLKRTLAQMESGYVLVRTGGQDTTSKAMDDLSDQIDTLEAVTAFMG
jgi:hypothetical protein